MNLAANRHHQLTQTFSHLGFSGMPQRGEDFTELQVEAAKEIGGIKTQMLLDAPEEVMKYHFGPLQVALCLLHVVLQRHRERAATDEFFRFDALDEFCRKHQDFVSDLGQLRDSLLHERYENAPFQAAFVNTFSGHDSAHMVALLIEANDLFQAYLRWLKNHV